VAAWTAWRCSPAEVAVHSRTRRQHPLDFVRRSGLANETWASSSRTGARGSARTAPRRIAAMERRLLVVPERQLAVMWRLAGVEQVVPWAVHCLHPICSFSDSMRNMFCDSAPMAGHSHSALFGTRAGSSPDVSRGHQHVRACSRRVCCRASSPSPARTSRGCPRMNVNRRARAPASVVALLGLFDLREVRLQVLSAKNAVAVDALHRLIARVAFPVRIRCAQQLERLQLAGRRDVGPTQKSMNVSGSLIV